MWDDKGRLIAATVISAEPNFILEKKDNQTTIGIPVGGKTNKAQRKTAESLGSKRGIWLKSVKGNFDGDKLGIDQFEAGEKVGVTATTKGKGFAGTIKRHNFHRGPVTHGSDNIRRPGSIGAQRPQRVPKGQKMAGHMGSAQLTVRGSKVLHVDKENNLLVVSGAVPGPKKGRVLVKSLEN